MPGVEIELESRRFFTIWHRTRMINSKPLTVSERFARALLAAWNSGELMRLEAALDATARGYNASLPACEKERIEVVREIASTIRLWLQGAGQKAQADLNAALRVLRHLARCENLQDDRWTGANGEPKEAPQSETPAFVPR